MIIPIDPSFAAQGGEWAIGLPQGGGQGIPGAGADAAPEGSFGGMLTKQIGALEHLQVQAADASRALATGTATDPEAVVMAVEKARLSMQLASQIRTKAVEAVQDIFHTQI